MNLSEFEKGLLALYLWQQNRSQGVKGLSLIGCVLKNRVLRGWHGGSWLPVLNQALTECSGPLIVPDPTDPLFVRLLMSIDEIHSGRAPMEANAITGIKEDQTGNALYWIDTSKPIPVKFREEILNRPDLHPKKATAESLWFFV